jgi:spore coat protein SA
MIYHLLDESFSAYTGLALSIVTANMLRYDENSIVVCSQADQTWGFSPGRVMVLPQLKVLTVTIKGSKMRGWRFIPPPARRRLICRIFGPVLDRLQHGDIVWCHNWPYVAEALAGAIRMKGAKLIYHAHNSLIHYSARTAFKAFTPDALIFNSEAMRKEAVDLLPYLRNTCSVHYGANESLFYPPPSGSSRNNPVPVILYVGRLVPQKGVHVLIEAMKILQERNVQVVCKVVGSSHAGGIRNKMTPYVRSLRSQSSPNIQFEGFRTATEIAQEYRSADIFCCPSIWQEPFGIVNIEALACGLPVVASRVGGIPEIAAGGGIRLVEPGSPIELAGALQTLIEDRDLRVRTGAEGLHSFRRRFTWPVICSELREICQSLVEDSEFFDSTPNSEVCESL